MGGSLSRCKAKVKDRVDLTHLAHELKGLRRIKPGVLLAWYDRCRRSMPWRAVIGVSPNPYHVWLSEVMLQQTTVATVTPYFIKFIRRWPRLEDLALASPDSVMQMWAGLGYYRRARLLHQCAKILMHDYGGQFPQSETALLSLPGFGPYTAAAVASIAFEQRASVVDGNVERVISRLFAIRKLPVDARKDIRCLAAKLLPDARFGDYAQALMDLGATICTPRNARCNECPWQNVCEAWRQNIVDLVPQRGKTIVRPKRYATAFVLTNKKKQIFLRQRPEKGLLGGMMEVPTSDWLTESMPADAESLRDAPLKSLWTMRPGIIRHIFSHFELQVRVATSVTSRMSTGASGHWVKMDDLKHEALPSVMRKIIHHAQKWI